MFDKKKYEKNFKFYYDIMLQNFTFYLNTNFERKYKSSHWEILIGPWLTLILQLLFIKYKNGFRIRKKKDNKICVNFDYNEFISSIGSENYHYDFIKILENKNIKTYYKEIKSINFDKKFYFIFKTLFFLFPIRVLYSASRFKIYDKIRLFIYTFFKVSHLPNLNRIFKAELDKKKNIRIINISIIKNSQIRKKKLFITFLKILPSSYLENFEILEDIVDKFFNNKIKYFCTDSSYLSDDLFKIKMMKSKINHKAKFLLEQHGGNHRLIKDEFSIFHERNIADKYFVWGQKKNKNEKTMPSLRVSRNIDNFIIKKGKENYEYCNILLPFKSKKFLYLFNYHFDVLNFYKKYFLLIKKKKLNFVFKIYPEQRYKSQLNKKQISKKFNINQKNLIQNQKVIKESKVIVVNYLSTMIFELLAANKPFIIFMPSSNNNFSNFGKKFLKELSDNKIYFNNQKDFFAFIKNINNVEKNWNNIITQRNLNFLRYKYIRLANENSNFNKWKHFFNKLV